VTARRRHRNYGRQGHRPDVFLIYPEVYHAADFKAEFIGKHPADKYPVPEHRLSRSSRRFF